MIKNSKQSIVRQATWVSLSILITRVLFFVTSIVTARFLLPHDFGLIGMSATITTLFQTSSATGIDNFVIAKKNLQSHEIDTAFTLNAIVGILLTSILIGFSPLFSEFYKQPEIKVILLYAGFALLANILGRSPKALLIKNMRQDLTALIDTTTNFLNFFFIIICVLVGFKYLTYVIAMLISQIVACIAYWLFAKHHFCPSFELKTVKSILHYGKSYLPQTLLAYLFSQSDYILGGMFLSASMLGYYYFGFEKAFLIVVLLRGLSMQVFFPLFANHQSDSEMLKRSYFKISSNVMLFMFPIIFMMTFCTKEFLHVFFGNRWDPALLTLQLLLGYCFLMINYQLCETLFNAIGEPRQNLRHYMIVVPLALIAYYIGVSNWQLTGLTISALLVNILSMLFMLLRVKLFFGWSFIGQLKHIGKHLILIILPLPILLPFKFMLLSLQLEELSVFILCSLVFGLTYIILVNHFYPSVLKRLLNSIYTRLYAKFSPANTELSTSLEICKKSSQI